jgi:hypothetical protein
MATEFMVITHYAEDGREDCQEQLTMHEARMRYTGLMAFIFADDFTECVITFQTEVLTITAIP